MGRSSILSARPDQTSRAQGLGSILTDRPALPISTRPRSIPWARMQDQDNRPTRPLLVPWNYSNSSASITYRNFRGTLGTTVPTAPTAPTAFAIKCSAYRNCNTAGRVSGIQAGHGLAPRYQSNATGYAGDVTRKNCSFYNCYRIF